MQRVQKLLSNYGYCSRRKAEIIIEAGRVKVNGKTISLGDKATETDQIKVDNKIVNKEKRTYLLFHKPTGCITALTDPRYKTIMEYIKIKERIFPVGRLDYNTSGILLLTNDGDFANQIMHPSHEIKKTYLAEIDKPIKESELDQIREGILLDDGKTSPAKAKKIGSILVEITIHEGKNRIVRRIFEKLGFTVKALKRIKVGKLNLGDLKPGQYRNLNDKDKKMIFE
ncbi:MAG: pseudouridine synthase [Candidatus Woesearchaeota archaeon]